MRILLRVLETGNTAFRRHRRQDFQVLLHGNYYWYPLQSNPRHPNFRLRVTDP